MSYSNPNRARYEFGNFDFGGGANETFTVNGPKGKAGRLVDYGVYGPIEAFAAGTNTPQMSIGTAADADAFGDELDFGALALDTPASLRSLYYPSDAGFASHMVNDQIPADTKVQVTCLAGTGSGLTGQAVPFVVIDWAD